MRIVRVEETVPMHGTIRLHHLTDLHVGAPDFDEPAFLERRKLIEDDPDARWVFGGDGGDLIRHNDRRYSPTELDWRYRQATDIRYATHEHLEKLFGPIMDKLWAACDGNHERKLDEHYGGKFGAELFTNLGKPERWVGYSGFVHVTFQKKGSTSRLTQLIDLHHGWQAGRSSGAFHNQAEKELARTDADIVLRGHSHRPDAAVVKTLGVTSKVSGTVYRLRSCVNGGTWRKGFRDDLPPVNPDKLSEIEGDLWSETKGFRAEPLGGPVLILRMDFGHGQKDRPASTNRPAVVQHTIVKGEINEYTLGLL